MILLQISRRFDFASTAFGRSGCGSPCGSLQARKKCGNAQKHAGGRRVLGGRLTFRLSLQRDLRIAAARWQGAQAGVDQGLVIARKPVNLPQFCAAMIEEITQASRHRTGLALAFAFRRGTDPERRRS
ncbi:MAG: hypothetical protein K2P95_03385 [Hyphomonadaceae bacterium]|nr:hypothetical protein [Hyphomonadaceae bacterium]